MYICIQQNVIASSHCSLLQSKTAGGYGSLLFSPAIYCGVVYVLNIVKFEFVSDLFAEALAKVDFVLRI
jgi:hypothetical protein